MDKLDFKEAINFSWCFNHIPCYEDNYCYTPTGNLSFINNNQFKFKEKELKFIPANRNTIFELVIGNIIVKPCIIHCYDKMQIYNGGKRRSMSINSFVFREFIGVGDNSDELMGLKVRISNKLLDQLLFSEKEI